MSATINIKAIFLLALIFISAYSQCTTTSSSLQYIITGVMQLGVPNQSFAQAQYNVVFSGSGSLGTAANIFYAFGILYIILSNRWVPNSWKSELLFLICRRSLFHEY
jgi:hypothetical protein